jgi:uncharacterized protein
VSALRRAAAVAIGVVALVVAADPATAAPPKFSAPVVDQAGVVTDSVERSVSAELEDYQRRSGNQIAVAVVATTGDTSLEDYSIDLARSWGVGTKGKDNGVLVLIANDDHRLRIEVGRGLEGDLTDLESGQIIRDEMTPRLKAGDVDGAVQVGTDAIRRALGDDLAAAPPVTQPTDDRRGGGIPGSLIVVALLLFSTIGGGFGRRRRSRWAGPLIFGSMMGGLGGFGRRGGGFGGGFGGGGFGGGFGGGGGGGFGGGGASGSW